MGSPREGNGNPLQYSCPESPMGRGALQATVHVVARVGQDLETKPTNQGNCISKSSDSSKIVYLSFLFNWTDILWCNKSQLTALRIRVLCWKVKVKSFSCVQLFATPWTVAYQAPPSMGVSRQEYWSGVPFPSPNICTQLCPTLCSPVESTLPGSSAHEIFRQEYWSGVPLLTPGNLPHPAIKPTYLALLESRFFTTCTSWEAHTTEPNSE